MAIYYALVKDNYIQKEIRNGQLEIYEDEALANKAKFSGVEVIAVDVSRIIAGEEDERT